MRRDSEDSEEQTIGQEKLPTVSVDVVPMTIGFHGLGNANSIHTVHRYLAQHERDRESGGQETNAAVDNNGRYHSKHLSGLKGQVSAGATGYTLLDLLHLSSLAQSFFFRAPAERLFKAPTNPSVPNSRTSDALDDLPE